MAIHKFNLFTLCKKNELEITIISYFNCFKFLPFCITATNFNMQLSFWGTKLYYFLPILLHKQRLKKWACHQKLEDLNGVFGNRSLTFFEGLLKQNLFF